MISESLAAQPFRVFNNIGPIIIGIMGQGNVGKGCKDICEVLGATEIFTSDLNDISLLDRSKIYYVVLSRKHFLQKDDKEEFSHQDFIENPDDYKVVFHQKYLPKLSVFMNCINWDKRYPRLLTAEQMNSVLESPENRLMVIGDNSCLPHGSIEFLHKAKYCDNPFYYYDLKDGMVESHRDASENSVVYVAVENAPAELPKDASQMFEDSLVKYLDWLASAEDVATTSMPDELSRANIILKGELTEQ
eukprot:CAMPEP_0168319608 /NCGR_PEP_ID=MMETSP0213-20121227/1158_1 /TAXON_ID=151035 /ORGANISM="Euplotes harpa, Strain FSP1.4" /LENGTH=246 /DNA_ID=CAMNT_0008320863 /DNA_START=568 /DNA_END=1305 /DNA_ORIENTATION=+